MRIKHCGSGLQFVATFDANSGVIAVELEDGRQSRIEAEGMSGCMPSCDGTVIAVSRVEGGLQFFDTVSGTTLSPEDVEQRSVKFYL